MESLKGVCMHEVEMNQDWCVCVHSPPSSFPKPSPQQDIDHLVSLMGDSWLAGYLLGHLSISSKLKPSSQVLKKNIYVYVYQHIHSIVQIKITALSLLIFQKKLPALLEAKT